MFTDIARFELRYQMRQPVFWVVTLAFFLFTFATVAVDAFNIGAGGSVHKNAPYAIAQTQLIMGMFSMFVTTAFVANAIVRDDDSGFAPIIRATRILKRDYLFGRFTGAFTASAIAFLAVPLGGLVGSFMPWIDPETLGATRPGAYIFSYAFLALPGLWLTATLFFAVATITRSIMWTYTCVVGLLIIYVIADILLKRPEFEAIAAIAEPFGISAYALTTKYWTAAERNSLYPLIDGLLLWNRLVWVAFGAGMLGLAFALFRPEGKGKAPGKSEGAIDRGPAARVLRTPLPQPVLNAATARTQLLARTRFDLAQVFRSPAFAILLALGIVNALLALRYSADLYGATIYPVTRHVIETLRQSFNLVPIIVAIYYAGELVWRERERRMHEIVDATPAPNWVLIMPKAFALALALVVMLLISAVAGMIFQTINGFPEYEIGKYLGWYVLPKAVDWSLLAILAVAFQVVAPSKYAGWGLMVLYMALTMISGQVGFNHNLYLYGKSPDVPLSDMNGQGIAGAAAWWFRAYWSAFAVLLLLLAHALWRRGSETRLKPRLAGLPQQLLRGPAGSIGLTAGFAFAALGGFIFTNTNVWNAHRDSLEGDRFAAEREKMLLRYERLPQPALTDVKLGLVLDPARLRVETDGQLFFENKTQAPLSHMHLSWNRDTRILALKVEGAQLETAYERLNYQIFRFSRPLAPGERRSLSFRTIYGQEGFKNSGNITRVAGNGTFVDSSMFGPGIGMSRFGLLNDRSKRRKYGLTSELRPNALDDAEGRRQNYVGVDRVNSDITVTTAADQTPIAPGSRVSDVTHNGRRVARFVSDAPILYFFSVQSARYAVHKQDHKGIALEIYHHPAHPWNVARMTQALGAGLDYFQANFSPYQYRQTRIIEFPAYEQFAQAFAGTMPYSESIGFITDLRDPSKIDYITFVTAHELAHQWWAHQVIGANVQGATSLSETLAQYSAMMVMEKLRGPDEIRKFLKYELDQYLEKRGKEVADELPLMRTENQSYVHYNKGALAMYLLRDQMGEEAVNRALRRLIARYAFKAAPYPTSRDLIAALRAEAKPAQQALITDLFEKITLYDVRTLGASSKRRADGRYDVAVTVDARKLYANGQGQEREAPLAEPFDVGLFSSAPDSLGFGRGKLVHFEQRMLRSGRQVLRFVTDRRPSFAGADPYNKRVDRNSNDNVVEVVG